jgi:drug/metabolite transporter (DMT)-like permease
MIFFAQPASTCADHALAGARRFRYRIPIIVSSFSMTRHFSATGEPARDPSSMAGRSATAALRTDKVAIRAGIAWMLLTTFLFVCQDSIARLLLVSYPAAELAFARFAVHMVVATALLAVLDPRLMVSRRPGLQLARSGFLLAATLSVMAALQILPFVDVAAVVWVTPVLVTGLSVLILGERINAVRAMSVVAGLIGVWMIVGQAGLSLSSAMLVPLLAAVANAFYQIATRMLRLDDPPMTTLFYTSVTGTVLCTALVPFVGVMPKAPDAALMILLGVFGVLSHFCFIRAFTAAPANIVAPFGYSTLLWATLFGLLLFAEIPRPSTLFGAVLIIGAGLAIFLHESKA